MIDEKEKTIDETMGEETLKETTNGRGSEEEENSDDLKKEE